jgi:DNA-binding MarR family transcriptional regulator
MSKNNVKEPFVKMYELKGLSSNETRFLCKVWSFQSNQRDCYLSNNTWADFLGCSPKTVGRIKNNMEKRGYIERSDSYVRMTMDMKSLIKLLKENHIPRYFNKPKLPSWRSEISGQCVDIGRQNVLSNTQDDKAKPKVEHMDSQYDAKPSQNNHQLDNNNTNEKELINEINGKDLNDWSLSLFQRIDVPNLGYVEKQEGEVVVRNKVLSLWYDGYSNVQLKPDAVKLFCNQNYFNVLLRIMEWVDDFLIPYENLRFVDINHFLKLIEKCYLEYQVNEINNAESISFDVALDVQLIIFEHGKDFNNYISKF